MAGVREDDTGLADARMADDLSMVAPRRSRRDIRVFDMAGLQLNSWHGTMPDALVATSNPPTVFSRARGWISDCDSTLRLGAEALDDRAHERPHAR